MDAASGHDWLGRITYEVRARWVHAYTTLGWQVCTAAYAREGGCSCGWPCCTSAGAHRTSVATTSPGEITSRLLDDPDANLMIATGGVVDALEVPAPLGRLAVTRMPVKGPIARSGASYLFLFASGRPFVGPGVRWHGAGSHILVPPSTLPGGQGVTWIHGPNNPLPDADALAHALAIP